MPKHVDALIIGAGFSGIYMTYKLREEGFTVQTLEKAAGVGGVWYFSRYPGARCDSDSFYYNFIFSEELYKKWSWSARFAGQEEILSYLNLDYSPTNTKSHRKADLSAFYVGFLFHLKDEKRIHFC